MNLSLAKGALLRGCSSEVCVRVHFSRTGKADLIVLALRGCVRTRERSQRLKECGCPIRFAFYANRVGVADLNETARHAETSDPPHDLPTEGKSNGAPPSCGNSCMLPQFSHTLFSPCLIFGGSYCFYECRRQVRGPSSKFHAFLSKRDTSS